MLAPRMHRGPAFLLWALAVVAWAGTGAATETGAAESAAGDDTLTILSVDATTLPGLKTRKRQTITPTWRTSFGSERLSEPKFSKPETAVEADIVMLQRVHDIRALRQWFPAGQWRLIVSRQALLRVDGSQTGYGAGDGVVPLPTTAVAVRYQPGLRVTGQDHLLDLADALGKGDTQPSAAGTAVRVLIDGRETWAISVILPEECILNKDRQCPGLEALSQWHADREADGVRRVTGGRFAPGMGDAEACARFGLRLDPAPPPPRQPYKEAAPTPDLGCAAAVTVVK
jgi:hypothetical protein